jgi:hypothetical protein
VQHDDTKVHEGTDDAPVVHEGTDEASAAHFAEHGWVLTDTLGPDGAEQVRAWVEEVAGWPLDGGDWLHHRELTEHGPALCRTENFTPFHVGLHDLLRTGAMVGIASNLLGEPAVLYKEKINYKLPGGAGYAPHQDAPAYPFIESHVSCMVAVDDATAENGCLEVVDTMEWTTVPVRAGQTLWFHSRTPHRSGPNTTDTPRRALYPTYNAASEGDLRADYYAEKLAAFRSGGRNDGMVRVSLINDFRGVAVPEDSP